VLRELANILKEIDELEGWLDNSAVAVNNEIILSLDRELKNGEGNINYTTCLWRLDLELYNSSLNIEGDFL